MVIFKAFKSIFKDRSPNVWRSTQIGRSSEISDYSYGLDQQIKVNKISLVRIAFVESLNFK